MNYGESPARVRASGSFRLELEPEAAFNLFTAAGEESWVPDWRPLFLGEPNPQRPGLVFITTVSSEQTIWTVLESDRDRGRLAYSRVTPGSRAGTVTVALAEDSGGTIVTVTYDLTALSPAAEADLAQYLPAKFESMMLHWRDLINASLHTE